jgi:agmatine deiminase
MMNIFRQKTPRELGYRFPAEWEKHAGTWLSYPHNETSWPGKIHTIFPYYHQFVKALAVREKVHINVTGRAMAEAVEKALTETGVRMENISLHIHLTNDAWCRDHGPAFVVNASAESPKAIVNWEYNSWGGKYPAVHDNQIPLLIAELMQVPVFQPGIVMEGGSIDVNGKGTLLTTTSCLLHINRNPNLKQEAIEQILTDFYGVEQVLWLGEGIEGDDTDGHVDDLARFINEDTVVTMVEHNKSDANYEPLKKNLKELSRFRLINGKQLNIVEIPMPDPLYYEGQRLPVSYANFYMANAGLMLPVFRCKSDDKAVSLLESCIRDRPIVALDSVEIIWGLGSWHCLSQQEPDVIQ